MKRLALSLLVALAIALPMPALAASAFPSPTFPQSMAGMTLGGGSLQSIRCNPDADGVTCHVVIEGNAAGTPVPVSGTVTATPGVGTFSVGRSAARLTALAAAAYTVTTNGTTLAVGPYDELGFYVNVTAVTGTTPSLTVSIQASSDGGTTWFTLASGVAITAAGQQKIDVGKAAGNNVTFGDTVRAVATITGTTPSFTMSIVAIGK